MQSPCSENENCRFTVKFSLEEFRPDTVMPLTETETPRQTDSPLIPDNPPTFEGSLRSPRRTQPTVKALSPGPTHWVVGYRATTSSTHPAPQTSDSRECHLQALLQLRDPPHPQSSIEGGTRYVAAK